MSEVEDKLSQARTRQRRVLRAVAGLAGAIVLGAIVAAAIAYFADGLGRLQVGVAPAEAAATATVEIVEGCGVVWNSGVWALPGPLTLRVGAAGFATETVAVGEAARARAHVDVILRERPAMVTATTEPGHPDTRWFLDGTLVARGARLEIELPGGEHTVEARQAGYAPASHTVTAERGAVLDLTLRMTRVRGRIEITSEPSGARVTHNGAAAGATPLSLEVEGGVHTLDIAHAGHATRTDTVEITHGSSAVERHYQLAQARARVSFELSPGDGVLTVDDRAAAAEIDLAAGVVHRVRYTKPGYAPRETEVELDPGERRTVTLVLDPVFGTVEVRSDPAAEIVVGGRTVGGTPQRLQLQTVPQTISLTRDGYRTETRTVTPEAGATRRVEVTLRPEAEVRLETAPSPYTHRTGHPPQQLRAPRAVNLGDPRRH
ncbi:MAG: PEGA domain-containing protein, partial [Thiotrichales bacterium]|nr:PEGA domain-containing protein [Thiotrichales bacterium]